MAERNEWFFPRGSLGSGWWESSIDDTLDGWQHTGLKVGDLADNSVELAALDVERIGRDTRQLHNFGTPGTLDAAELIVCEVITPAGNWSSHPAHKHDEQIVGHESQLEEIYYFEAAPARGTDAPVIADPFGSFATYSSPVGDIETNALVRTGDIALVPYGYHGPAVAAPEYDLFYLNVMAGPGSERVWLVSDDPRQAWLRNTWSAQEADQRLPFTPTYQGAKR